MQARDQGRQKRDQVNGTVMLLVRGQRGVPSVACADRQAGLATGRAESTEVAPEMGSSVAQRWMGDCVCRNPTTSVVKLRPGPDRRGLHVPHAVHHRRVDTTMPGGRGGATAAVGRRAVCLTDLLVGHGPPAHTIRQWPRVRRHGGSTLARRLRKKTRFIERAVRRRAASPTRVSTGYRIHFLLVAVLIVPVLIFHYLSRRARSLAGRVDIRFTLPHGRKDESIPKEK